MVAIETSRSICLIDEEKRNVADRWKRQTDSNSTVQTQTNGVDIFSFSIHFSTWKRTYVINGWNLV